MPGALNRPIGQNVSERHFKILMRAIVSYSRHPATTPNQANSLSIGLNNGQHSLGGNLVDRCNRLKSALSAHYVDYPDKFT